MDLDDLREAALARELETEWRDRFAEMLRQIARTASEARRVLDHSSHDDQGLADALGALRGQLIQALQTEDADLFGAIGDLIDPRRHKVIGTREATTAAGVVLEVESEGLEWEAKVLEKAAVIASRSPGGEV